MESLISRLDELSPIPNNIARIHYTFFQKNNIVPLGCRKHPVSLVVALPEGENSGKTDILSIYANMPVERKNVSRDDFVNYLNAFKEDQGREVVIGVVEDLGESALSDIAQEIPNGHDLSDYAANEPPIIKLVNLLFSIAVKDRASDIHLQPLEKELRVRFRIDGLLYNMYKPPKRAQNAIVSWFTVASPFFHEQEAKSGNIKRIRAGEVAATAIVLATGAAVSASMNDHVPLVAAGIICAVFVAGYEYQIANPSKAGQTSNGGGVWSIGNKA